MKEEEETKVKLKKENSNKHCEKHYLVWEQNSGNRRKYQKQN